MSLAEVYDRRYSGNYRQDLSGYEVARWKAVEHFVTRVTNLSGAKRVMDYGAGSGLHVDLWERIFPDAELHFCDISSVGIEKLKTSFPKYEEHCSVIQDNRADASDQEFDVVVSIEVMEHVEDLTAYLTDVCRLLKPGGHFVWTTPCSNELSIEDVYAKMTGTIDPTAEGYRRWRWEEPTHIRRMKSGEAEQRLRDVGFTNVDFRFRAHLFSFLVSALPHRWLRRAGQPLMYLDYSLFRRLRNGASMIGVARKC